MHIGYVHASKFGNGATVADAFRESMAERGITVDVHHVQRYRPTGDGTRRSVRLQLARSDG